MSRYHPVLLDGAWRPARAEGAFRAVDPLSGDELEDADGEWTSGDVPAAS